MALLVKNEAAARLILGLDRELAGKGFYGHSDHGAFVACVTGELSELRGESKETVTIELESRNSTFEHLKITGKENPIYFSTCCQTIELVHAHLRSCGLTLPAHLSVGLAERHESLALAASELDPPLLLFSSGQFDLMWDVAFSFANPTLRVTGRPFLNPFEEHDPDEQELICELLIHHSLSSHYFDSPEGGFEFIYNRIGDPPALRAKIGSSDHRKAFLELLFSGRAMIPAFLIGHEIAHLSNEARNIGEQEGKIAEELFCDKIGLQCATYLILRSARESRTRPQLIFAKLAMLLNYVHFMGFLELVKTAEHRGVKVSAISSSERRDNYPSPQDRMGNSKEVIFLELSNRIAAGAAENLSSLWQELGRRNRRAFESNLDDIDKTIERTFRGTPQEFAERWSKMR